MDAVKRYKKIIKDYEKLTAEYKQMLNDEFKRTDSYEKLVEELTKKINNQESTINLLGGLLSIVAFALTLTSISIWIIL